MKLYSLLIITETIFFCYNTVYAENQESGIDKYYTLGIKTAQKEYWGIKPFVTGFAVGMALPAAVVATVSLTHEAFDNSDTAEVLGGASVFATGLWGGYRLVKTYKPPEPEVYMTGFTETQKQSFESGFTTRVKDKQLGKYIIGTYFGITIPPIVFLYIVFHDWHGYD